MPREPPSPRSARVAARTLSRLAQGLRARGVGIDQKWDLDEGPDAPEGLRVSSARTAELWREGLLATRDELLGAHLAATEPLGRWGELEQLLLCSRGFEDMVLQAQRFWPLVADGQRFHLVRTADEARLELWSPHPEGDVARQLYESELLYVRRFVEVVFGAGVRPLRIELKREVQGVVGRELADLFGVPVTGSADIHALVYEPSALQLVSPCASPSLAADLSRRLEARLAGELSEDVVDWVRSLMRKDPSVTLDDAAAHFMVGPRAFQRRLEAEGVTWRRLKDDARRERALDLLADPKVSVAHVAGLLGYSEPSALHRSFRRWTGTTVNRWRAELDA